MLLIFIASLGGESSTVNMPDVVNMNYYEAVNTIEDTLSFEVHISKEIEYSNNIEIGNVIRTSPEAGTQLSSNDEIVLFISEGVEVVENTETTEDKEDTASENENTTEDNDSISNYEFTITFNTKNEYSYEISNLSVDEPEITLVSRKDCYGDNTYYAILPAGTYEVELADIKKSCQMDHCAMVFIEKNEYYKWIVGTANSACYMDSSKSYTIQECPDDADAYWYDLASSDDYTEYRIHDKDYMLTGISPETEYLNKATVTIPDGYVAYIDINSNGYAMTVWNKLK
jgi:hypothetical protein